MGSVGNQSPGTSYDTYKDCSQGLCSIYCPQWCYIIYPPPPFGSGDSDNGDPSTDFSPLIIGIIGILASAFLLITYYAIISKYYTRRGNRNLSPEFENYRDDANPEAWQENSDGLDETLIKSITARKYQKGDGLVEGTDCSVCLSEFQENEILRLLPKCNHAFHLPCIDTWLRSHSSCPLCRSNITTTESLPPQEQVSSQESNLGVPVSATDGQHRNDPVLVNQDIERGVSQDFRDVTNPERQSSITETGSDDAVQPVRRSFSTNYLYHSSVSIADILREEDDEIRVRNVWISVGIEPSGHSGGGQGKAGERREALHTDKSLMAVRRSISAGRFMFSRYEKGKNYIIPN